MPRLTTSTNAQPAGILHWDSEDDFGNFAPLRLLCVIACLCFPAIASASSSHPMSYTEAWLTISDRIEVRIKVFTDDIVRYDLSDSVASSDEFQLPEKITAAEFNEMLERQASELLQRMTLYHDGRRLTGRITEKPEPWDLTGEIDVAGSANVKHTVTFEFDLPEGPLKSLTVHHDLNPPGVIQPGELRLHSRHKEFRQRLDAVIPHDVNYTLVYDEDGKSKTATSVANTMQSRIIVSPFAVTHEMTLPLSLLAESFSDETDSSVGDRPLLTVAEQDRMVSQLTSWLNEHGSLSLGQQSVIWDKPFVQLFENGVIPATPVPAQVRSAVPVPATLIGLRFSWPQDGQVAGGELMLNQPLQADQVIRCETIVGANATTSEVSFATVDEAPNASKLLHEWTATSESEPPLSVATDVSSEDLLQRERHDVGLAEIVIAAFSFGFVLLLWYVASRRKSGGLKKLSLGLATAWLLMFAAISLPSRVMRVNDEAVEAWVSAAVPEIYIALQQPGVAAFDDLNRWLSDDLTETTYVTLAKQMHQQSDAQTWMAIDSVVVDAIDAERVQGSELLEVEAKWQLRGTAYHWGHAHAVSREHAGTFEMARGTEGWRIQKIHTLTAQPTQEVAEPS